MSPSYHAMSECLKLYQALPPDVWMDSLTNYHDICICSLVAGNKPLVLT